MSKASAYFTVNGLDDKHDVKELKRELDLIHGVNSVSVSGRSIAVDFDTTGADQEHIRRVIQNLGYYVTDSQLYNHTM